MPPKRKRGSKPRESKRSAIRRNRKQVHVVPNKLLGWKLIYGNEKFTITKKEDAVNLGRLVAGLASAEYSVSLYIHNKRGEIVDERTFTRTDDPPGTPG